MSDYNGEMVSEAVMGEITRLGAANDRLRKQVEQLGRAVVALVMMAGGNVVIPDDMLLLADEKVIMSMLEMDGTRLVVR